MALEAGQVVEGKVVRLLPYGAVVEVEDGTKGLVHISQIAAEYVRDVSEHLREGDVVKVRVMAERQPGKWEFSIKALNAPDAPAGRDSSRRDSSRRDSSRRDPGGALDKKISQFMRDSRSRQADVSRWKDRRGRGRR